MFVARVTNEPEQKILVRGQAEQYCVIGCDLVFQVNILGLEAIENQSSLSINVYRNAYKKI